MKKKMYRILALICVCVMMVCSFSFAADVTPTDVTPTSVNSVYYGSTCGRYNAYGYTETSTIGDIGVSLDGEVILSTYVTYGLGGTAENVGHSIDCQDNYPTSAISGWVDATHWYGSQRYYSDDML